MKHLLLSLALITSANAWADDEFPIELTCESGGNIFYFNIESDEANSWWKHHEGNYDGFTKGIYSNKWFEKKNKSLKVMTLNSEKIIVQMGTRFYPAV